MKEETEDDDVTVKEDKSQTNTDLNKGKESSMQDLKMKILSS